MLKILKFKKQLELYQKQREELSALDSSFLTRSQELESSMNEAETQEDIDLVSGEIDTLEKEKGEHDSKVKDLDEKIAGIEKEMADLESNAPDNADPPPAGERKQNVKVEVRESMYYTPIKRTRSNPFGQRPEDREQYLARAEVKEFYEKLVELGKQKRGIDGAEIGIPEITTSYIRDSVIDYSVLLAHVSLTRLRGRQRIPIAGPIPEAIWTDCCATLNEVGISFDIMELDCWKVGAFIPVCLATLQDFGGPGGLPSLASEIEYNLMMAIGKAVDRAIIYGEGIKMPIGFVRALDLATNPRDPSDRKWDGRIGDNIQSISGDGLELFRKIMIFSAKARRRGARGSMVWIMNEDTWKTRIAPESLQVNSAGTMVAVSGMTFPILGGSVAFVDEDVVKTGDIVGGYLENYRLLERWGMELARSDHRYFIEEIVLFKGTARYDGSPVIPFRDSFFAININGQAPATSSTFPPDLANDEIQEP